MIRVFRTKNPNPEVFRRIFLLFCSCKYVRHEARFCDEELYDA